jgi:hypothetical protein
MVGKRLLGFEHDLYLIINLGEDSERGGKVGSRHVLCGREVSLARATDSLQVWNVAPSSHDDELAPPSEPCCRLHSAVYIAVPVPVTGDEIHIRADNNMAVMDFNAAGSVEAFFDIDESRVFERLGVRDEGAQPNDLLAMAQGLVVVCLCAGPCLFGCERLRGEGGETTYSRSDRFLPNQRHDIV